MWCIIKKIVFFSNIYVNIWGILSLFDFKIICLSDLFDWA
jgi:hypothetical protein